MVCTLLFFADLTRQVPELLIPENETEGSTKNKSDHKKRCYFYNLCFFFSPQQGEYGS